MSETKRTPTPWTANDQKGEIYAPGGELVAQVIRIADVRFIIRACNSFDELLAALKAVAKELDAVWRHNCPSNRYYDKAMEVIAKAERS